MPMTISHFNAIQAELQHHAATDDPAQDGAREYVSARVLMDELLRANAFNMAVRKDAPVER